MSTTSKARQKRKRSDQPKLDRDYSNTSSPKRITEEPSQTTLLFAQVLRDGMPAGKLPPFKFDPLKFDPVQSDPVQTDLVQTNPVQTDPVQSDPVQTDPVQSDLVQTDLVQTNPVQTDPVQSDLVQTDLVQTDPDHSADEEYCRLGRQIIDQATSSDIIENARRRFEEEKTSILKITTYVIDKKPFVKWLCKSAWPVFCNCLTSIGPANDRSVYHQEYFESAVRDMFKLVFVCRKQGAMVRTELYLLKLPQQPLIRMYALVGKEKLTVENQIIGLKLEYLVESFKQPDWTASDAVREQRILDQKAREQAALEERMQEEDMREIRLRETLEYNAGSQRKEAEEARMAAEAEELEVQRALYESLETSRAEEKARDDLAQELFNGEKITTILFEALESGTLPSPVPEGWEFDQSYALSKAWSHCHGVFEDPGWHISTIEDLERFDARVATPAHNCILMMILKKCSVDQFLATGWDHTLVRAVHDDFLSNQAWVEIEWLPKLKSKLLCVWAVLAAKVDEAFKASQNSLSPPTTDQQLNSSFGTNVSPAIDQETPPTSPEPEQDAVVCDDKETPSTSPEPASPEPASPEPEQDAAVCDDHQTPPTFPESEQDVAVCDDPMEIDSPLPSPPQDRIARDDDGPSAPTQAQPARTGPFLQSDDEDEDALFVRDEQDPPIASDTLPQAAPQDVDAISDASSDTSSESDIDFVIGVPDRSTYANDPNVCKFWVKGLCTAGVWCTRPHPGEDRSNRGDPKAVVCPHWRKGNCKFSAATCRHLHPEGEDANLASSGSEQQMPKRDICIFFRNGNCRFGDRCNNLHAEPDKSIPQALAASWRQDEEAQLQQWIAAEPVRTAADILDASGPSLYIADDKIDYNDDGYSKNGPVVAKAGGTSNAKPSTPAQNQQSPRRNQPALDLSKTQGSRVEKPSAFSKPCRYDSKPGGCTSFKNAGPLKCKFKHVCTEFLPRTAPHVAAESSNQRSGPPPPDGNLESGAAPIRSLRDMPALGRGPPRRNDNARLPPTGPRNGFHAATNGNMESRATPIRSLREMPALGSGPPRRNNNARLPPTGPRNGFHPAANGGAQNNRRNNPRFAHGASAMNGVNQHAPTASVANNAQRGREARRMQGPAKTLLERMNGQMRN
ncbi:hypothetical protein P280DRAFT_553684 [Massarina eburnea CBS 473.64]|uniref:C3H1-type domain-containing protein n=1 Tax=Massarina eburnea CBS 473.64 TaxID=1395130 RepID=A0A6A6RJW4_9PLEO|nr:hypothetical protein P280DRAFT_553684 [Massarina eburnea CBS 473.64]